MLTKKEIKEANKLYLKILLVCTIMIIMLLIIGFKPELLPDIVSWRY